MREFKAGIHRQAAIARLRRQMVAALKAHLAGLKPAPPLAGVPLWQAFGALSALRRWGPNGPDPIQPSEVKAWADLNGVHLPPHHVAIITAMEEAWIADARTDGGGVVGQLSGAQFDAMFG